MIRKLIEELLLFALPFLMFYGYLALVGRNPRDRSHWEGKVFRLTLSGIALVVLSLIAAGVFHESHRGGYVPPHMEGGVLVPGRFQ